MNRPLDFETLQNRRLTNIRRNYQLLTANLSPVNIVKYMDYIQTKPYHEILDDFDCLYTVPNDRVWVIVSDIIEKCIKGNDVRSLEKILFALEEFKNSCIAADLAPNENLICIIEKLSCTIGEQKSLHEDRRIARVASSIHNFPNGSDLAVAAESYMKSVMALFEATDDTSDEEILEQARIMLESEEKIGKAEARASEEFEDIDEEEPETTPEQGKAAKESLIRTFKMYEIIKGLLRMEHGNPDECKEDMIKAYTAILDGVKYNRADYDLLYNKLKDVRDAAGSNHENPEFEKSVDESLSAIEMIQFRMARETGTHSVFNKNGELKNYPIIEDDRFGIIATEASPDIIAELTDYELLEDWRMEELVDNYRLSYNRWFDTPNMENLTAMAKDLTKIEALLEDSGRDSLRAKIARKNEEIVRKGVSAIKKAQHKGDNARVAAKRSAEHVDNFISDNIQKLLNASYEEKRREIVEGGFRVRIMNILRKAARTGVLYAINPILGLISLLGTVAKDATVDASVRAKIVRDYQEELKMIDEKIEDARSDGNRKEKYKLMRMKAQYERELERVSTHSKKMDIKEPTAGDSDAK